MPPRARPATPLSALFCSTFLLVGGCQLTGQIVGGEAPPEADAGSGDPPGDRVDADLTRPDATPPLPGTPDAAPPPVGGPDAAPLAECPGKPSIDRLEEWLASGEGQTVPATGSLLVPEGDHYVAKVQLVGSEWHVVVVWMGNQFEAQEDFSAASGFTLTYSATDDLYVQLRPGSHWSGGDKYVTAIPSTNGQVVTRTFSFAPSAWTTIPELGTPSYPYADALREVRGLVFVGETPNDLAFYGLRVDGFSPPCL
jgi:hypothetical protein